MRTHLTRLLLSLLLLCPACITLADNSTTPRIMVLGDSLSAAYGMQVSQGWVNLLQQRLIETGHRHYVVNASATGSTTGDGLGRLAELLKAHQPQLVIVELGGNDGLRGYPVKLIRQNLQEIVQQSRDGGAQVILLSIEIPPNYGRRYTEQFRASFKRVADAVEVPLVPFILEGVGVRAELMQEDGIHPTAQAQTIMLDNIWPYIEAML